MQNLCACVVALDKQTLARPPAAAREAGRPLMSDSCLRNSTFVNGAGIAVQKLMMSGFGYRSAQWSTALPTGRSFKIQSRGLLFPPAAPLAEYVVPDDVALNLVGYPRRSAEPWRSADSG